VQPLIAVFDNARNTRTAKPADSDRSIDRFERSGKTPWSLLTILRSSSVPLYSNSSIPKHLRRIRARQGREILIVCPKIENQHGAAVPQSKPQFKRKRMASCGRDQILASSRSSDRANEYQTTAKYRHFRPRGSPFLRSDLYRAKGRFGEWTWFNPQQRRRWRD